MPFNSNSGKKAGQISKRGRALPVELRANLNDLVGKIINDIDYDELSASQKIKLLDVCLKYSLPRLSIQKSLEEFETPRDFEINIIGNDGKVIETHHTTMDKDFQFKNALGGK